MDDAVFVQLMGALCGADEADLWDAVAADVASGVLDVATLCDPAPTWTEGERAAAGGLLASESPWLTTADLEDKYGMWWTGGPQEDREDDTADEHDERTRDWNSTTEDDQ